MMTRDELKKAMADLNYIASDDVVDASYSAICLRKPLLVDGPPGAGKTELAKTLAKITNSTMIRMQCYHGLEPSDILYDVDREKIASYQNMLAEKIKKMVDGLTWEAAVEKMEKGKFFSNEDFIIKRTVYQAIDPKDNRYKLLLIDEIDKASEKIEALLLETLAEFSMTIPELGTIYADPRNHPLVVITANKNRELGEPLRRRCIYLYIDYPSMETEINILVNKCRVPQQFAKDAAQLVQDMRHNAGMKKPPSISEVIDWVNAMYYNYGIAQIHVAYWEAIIRTGSTLAKSHDDLIKFKDYMHHLVEGK